VIKVLSVALLMLGGALLGTKSLARIKAELKLTEAMAAALGLMSGDIGLCARPLPEVFARAAQCGPEALRELFGAMSLRCGLESAAEVWQKCAEGLELGDTAKKALMSLSPVLGAYDAESQCREIERVRGLLYAEVERLRAEIGSRAKNRPALGACLAGIAAMLLI